VLERSIGFVRDAINNIYMSHKHNWKLAYQTTVMHFNIDTYFCDCGMYRKEAHGYSDEGKITDEMRAKKEEIDNLLKD
jgi:hypothetical protein